LSSHKTFQINWELIYMSREAVGLDGLTDPQREGAALIAAGIAPSAIAERLSVERSTVSRWQRDKRFRSAVAALVAERDGELAGALRELAMLAVDRIEDCLSSPDPAVRLKAAALVMQSIGAARMMKASIGAAPDHAESAG
jgi:transcriptional regulator with XRE-family HTH domain